MLLSQSMSMCYSFHLDIFSQTYMPLSLLLGFHTCLSLATTSLAILTKIAVLLSCRQLNLKPLEPPERLRGTCLRIVFLRCKEAEVLTLSSSLLESEHTLSRDTHTGSHQQVWGLCTEISGDDGGA